MSRNIESLPCRVQEAVEMPSRIDLVGEELWWDVPNNVFEEELGDMKPRPIDGCLRDFVRLARASPEDVLAFALKRGVLGIAPLVELDHLVKVRESVLVPAEDGSLTESVYHNPSHYRKTRYREPVHIYIELARQAKNIIQVMRRLRDGRSANDLRKAEIEAMASVGMRDTFLCMSKLKPRDIYERLNYAFFYWQNAANTKLGVSIDSELERTNGTPELAFPCFAVDFGGWEDGGQWDWNRYRYLRTGDRLVFPPPRDAGSEAIRNLTSEEYTEKYVIGRPYQEYIAGEAQFLPFENQRPSPLFNVLTFQLMKEIAIDEATFFCAGCGEMKTRDLLNKRRPRLDRAEYCDDNESCKADARRAYDRQYKAERKAGTRIAKSPQKSQTPDGQ